MNELESGAQIQWQLQRRCLGFSHTLLQPYPNMRWSLAISPLWKDGIRDHRQPAKPRGWRRTESNIPRFVPFQNLIRCPSLGSHSIINDLSGSGTIFTLLERREEKGKGHFLRIWADLIGQGEKAADIAAGEAGSSNSHKTQIPCCASDGKSFLSGV